MAAVLYQPLQAMVVCLWNANAREVNMAVKYIIADMAIKEYNITYNVPILFPDFISHQHIASKLDCMARSAGFVSWDEEGIPFCHGESRSLDLKPAKGDSDIILRMERGY
jgi:hypothetical protein